MGWEESTTGALKKTAKRADRDRHWPRKGDVTYTSQVCACMLGGRCVRMCI